MPAAHIVNFNLRVILRFISVLSSRIQVFSSCQEANANSSTFTCKFFLKDTSNKQTNKKELCLQILCSLWIWVENCVLNHCSSLNEDVLQLHTRTHSNCDLESFLTSKLYHHHTAPTWAMTIQETSIAFIYSSIFIQKKCLWVACLARHH